MSVLKSIDGLSVLTASCGAEGHSTTASPAIAGSSTSPLRGVSPVFGFMRAYFANAVKLRAVVFSVEAVPRSKPSDIAGFHSISTFILTLCGSVCQDDQWGGSCRTAQCKPRPLSQQERLPGRPIKLNLRAVPG